MRKAAVSVLFAFLFQGAALAGSQAVEEAVRQERFLGAFSCGELVPTAQEEGDWRVAPPDTPGAKGGRRPHRFTLNASLFAAPMLGIGAADESSPSLAPYGDYWSAGGGLQIDVHFRVLSIADAYVGLGAVHHSSTGSRDWVKQIGANELKIRYKFAPLYLFPIEFGGKGYLNLRSPLKLVGNLLRDPMVYLRIGAGPVFLTGVNFKYSRYVDGVLTEQGDTTWWPAQSVLGVHVALGFEWGGFRPLKGLGIPGLFFELGYRFISAPLVPEFGDDSGSMHTILICVGAHLP